MMTGGKARVRAEGRTHRGMVRERNEDALLLRSDDGLWVVADGMGGHAKGDEASLALVKALAAMKLYSGDGLSESVQAVENTVARVHAFLRLEALQEGKGPIGSTIAVVLVRNGLAVCLWVGDSRIYHGSQGNLTCATWDHALSTRELTRAVGAGAECWMDTTVLPFKSRDRILLCTDGLNKEVSDKEIAAELHEASRDAAACADRLFNLALARGARDNVSLIVLEALP